MSDASTSLSLGQALRVYLDARSAAAIIARRSLSITEMDARALLFIVDNPGTRPTTLREYLGITSAGVTTLIDRLVDRDVVRRAVDSADRRVNRITATIDLADEPWSALGQFDADFDVAASAKDQTVTGDFASLLGELTDTTVGTRH